MAARLCPHCDTRSNFDHRVSADGIWGKEPERVSVTLQTWQCQQCGGLIVVILKHREQRSPARELPIYPAAVPGVDASVPEAVGADYIEGVECLGIGAYKAAVNMFRRALQQVMLEKNAPKGKRLIDQIDALVDDRVLPQDIGEWAHEIRLWGNDGAHPSNDGLEKVTEEETEEVRGFLERLFESVYIMPAKVVRSRVSRDAKR